MLVSFLYCCCSCLLLLCLKIEYVLVVRHSLAVCSSIQVKRLRHCGNIHTSHTYRTFLQSSYHHSKAAVCAYRSASKCSVLDNRPELYSFSLLGEMAMFIFVEKNKRGNREDRERKRARDKHTKKLTQPNSLETLRAAHSLYEFPFKIHSWRK